MKEIEILIEVKSSKDQALRALEKFSQEGVKKTLDVYFFDPLREDLKLNSVGRLNRCFRLREKDGQSLVAYKVDHFDNDEWIYSDEHETEIADFKIMMQIIEALGLKELVRIDNEKHIYKTSDYEIVLEDVKDLGLFLEVERLAEVADDEVENTKKKIREFLKTLNIEFGDEQNAGKPELMLRKLSK